MATKITGAFTGKIRTQVATALYHENNHALSLVEVVGTQASTDPLWNGSQITYWGTADVVDGSGPQQGYWCNEHAEGDRDWGTFKGRITISRQEASMEGTYTITGGTGRFKGISGGGTFKGHFPSPSDVVNNWEGDYTFSSAQASH